MSTHVAITGLLCLLLVVALVKYRAARTGGTNDRSRADGGRALLGKASRRLGRASGQIESEPPRQRRNRPRLGLTVSGVPTEEALLKTSDEPSGPGRTQEPMTVQSIEDSDAAILELAAGTVVGDDNSPTKATRPGADVSPERDLLPDDTAEDVPVALRGVVQDVGVIEAPGWPQPGELGLSSATDGFADARAPEIGDEGEGADDLITASLITVADAGDDDRAESIPDGMWDEPVTEFDPASGWDPPEEDQAEPVPAAVAADWSAADPDAVLDESWTLPPPIDEVPLETFARDSDVPDDEGWNVTEWELASVAAPETTAAGDWSTQDVDLHPSGLSEDAPAFAWPSDDPEPDLQLDPAAEFASATVQEPAVDGPPSFDIDQLTTAAGVGAPEAIPWKVPNGTPDAPADETPRARADLTETPRRHARDKRTRQLEKRLAAAEAELKRIAKRTKGKKGDLRTAGKDKIAKQVRKALGDPEIAHHFDLQVGKGRFAFERRSAEPPVVTLGATVDRAAHDGATGSELLTALEGPLRANLLAMLLSEYAHAEADRRVEALRSGSHGNGNGIGNGDPDGFDALVVRLAELSQGALMGIDPPRRSR